MTVLAPRWLMPCMLAIAVALVPVSASASTSGRILDFFGIRKKKIERIVVEPPTRISPDAVPASRPVPPAGGRTACVDVRHVAGAQVFGDTAVELTLVGGKRWRMFFAQACPALSFYDGFYYRRAEEGRLCAGRDAIIARSGGECAIASIVPLKSLRRPRSER